VKFTKLAALATVALVAASWSARAADLSGAGSTFVYPVLAKWADTYKKETGIGLNYQSIGSGGGIKQIKAKTVVFGATDAPLSGKELDEAGLAQFPIIMGGIVPVVNLDGIKPGDLTIDGTTLARIYLGEIKKWNDPAIAKLNPDAKLPSTAIALVHRSDGSGTTFNFTNYLGKVNPEWQSRVGADTSVTWPSGIGGKGNAGVAASVQQAVGAIGYVEYAYAMQSKLIYADMTNAAGKRVHPSMGAFQAAAANADFSKVRDFYEILTDQPGAASWPITAATYMLLRADYPADKNRAVLKFLDWALHDGQADAKQLDYVPLPDNVVKQIEASWKTTLHVTP
jgi:phosphate transport system substrate-binding protein